MKYTNQNLCESYFLHRFFFFFIKMLFAGYRESCKTLFFSEKLQTFTTGDKEYDRRLHENDYEPKTINNELAYYDSMLLK